MSARGPAPRGNQELSAKKRSETEGADDPRHSKKSRISAHGARTQRSGDLGRALRSVYDDTLREPVPDDFLNLLGKLS
jgi:Anti-sigma factor NepR